MKIYIGSDHNGFRFKEILIKHLTENGNEVVDEGDNELKPDDDFPEFAGRTVSAMLAAGGNNPMGILLCGSGQGMCIAANRHKQIRAALGWSEEAARSSRNDDDSNVLCLPVNELPEPQLLKIVDVWMKTPFSGASRFVRRIKAIDEL